MKGLFYAARPIVSDMLSTILFAALFALTNNIYLSTGAAMALGIGQVGLEKVARHGRCPACNGRAWAWSRCLAARPC